MEEKIYYTEEEDFFNSYGTRNSDNTKEPLYNCGGYALNTYSWYLPYSGNTSDEDDDILYLVEEGYTQEEIYEIKLAEYTAHMLRDFPNLRLLVDPTEIKENERLIYFRIFYEEEYCGDDEGNFEISIHSDFHYRYFEDGHWYEKCGGSELNICDDDMDGDWHGGNDYDSRTVYFGLKMED